MYDFGYDSTPEIPVYDEALEDAFLEEEYEDRFLLDDDIFDLYDHGYDDDDTEFFDGLTGDEIDRFIDDLPF